MDTVPAWLDLASTLGTAVVGGAVGAWGAIKGPLAADKRLAEREHARAIAERDRALVVVDGQVKANLAIVSQLGTAALAPYAEEITDGLYNAQRATLAHYLDAEDFASLDELFVQFRQLQADRTAGRDVAGTLRVVAENGRTRLELIRRLLENTAEMSA